MNIGFDAKRAFSNNTGLGNYSRDTIRILSEFYSDNEYLLYTPKNKKNPRLSFLSNRDNTSIFTPNSLINKTFKRYWRSRNIVKDLLNLNNLTSLNNLTALIDRKSMLVGR